MLAERTFSSELGHHQPNPLAMHSLLRLATLTTCLVAPLLLTGCGIDYLKNSPQIGYRTGPEMRDVPFDAQTETIGGTRYFTHDGTYYRPRNGYYTAVDPVL